MRRVMNSRSVALAWRASTPSQWIQGDSVVSTPKAAGFSVAVGRLDFGAAVAAVHAQRHRQGPGQRVEAAIGAFGQQLQQLDQLLAPDAACQSTART
jgi:hypothetical protein